MSIFDMVKYVFTIRKMCDVAQAISLDGGWFLPAAANKASDVRKAC